GFTLAATVHIFNLKKYEPIVRPAILTAFLGYVLVIVALLFDLGLPYRVWHPLVMWNPHSVMFEVGWCVTLYTTVLSLEFAPAVLERLRWQRPLKLLRAVMIPLVILGVLLSTLHQSSLGSLFLIVPTKLHGLWYTPLLPVFFFFSALMVGLAMTIFESWHSSKAFGRQLEMPLLRNLARVLAVLIAAYLTMRFLDLARRGALGLLLESGSERYFFALETLLLALPMVLLFRERIRANARALYFCAVLTIFGFVANRLNVSVTGLEAGSGVSYVPKWTEVAITLAIVAAGFAVFYLAVKYLPIFEEAEAKLEPALRPLEKAASTAVD
ncbi:MAG TPA: NrfD/PsrC family molybdoenzyme membrane anchor subunit, partial [Bryobacteraceae bacterium]|nr:NrfD/PsrC family molybdoenzyme membrane anchor subunit [Bryobacteraceae bacterium]